MAANGADRDLESFKKLWHHEPDKNMNVKLILPDEVRDKHYLHRKKRPQTEMDKEREFRRIEFICKTHGHIPSAVPKPPTVGSAKTQGRCELEIEKRLIAPYRDPEAFKRLAEKVEANRKRNRKEKQISTSLTPRGDSTVNSILPHAERSARATLRKSDLDSTKQLMIEAAFAAKMITSAKSPEKKTAPINPATKHWLVILNILKGALIVRGVLLHHRKINSAANSKYRAAAYVIRHFWVGFRVRRNKPVTAKLELDDVSLDQPVLTYLRFCVQVPPTTTKVKFLAAQRKLFEDRQSSVGLIVSFLKSANNGIRVSIRSYLRKIRQVQRVVKFHSILTVDRINLLNRFMELSFIPHLVLHINTVAAGKGFDCSLSEYEKQHMVHFFRTGGLFGAVESSKSSPMHNGAVCRKMWNAEFHAYIRSNVSRLTGLIVTYQYRHTAHKHNIMHPHSLSVESVSSPVSAELSVSMLDSFIPETKKTLYGEIVYHKRKEHVMQRDLFVKRMDVLAFPDIVQSEVRRFICGDGVDPLQLRFQQAHAHNRSGVRQEFTVAPEVNKDKHISALGFLKGLTLHKAAPPASSNSSKNQRNPRRTHGVKQGKEKKEKHTSGHGVEVPHSQVPPPRPIRENSLNNMLYHPMLLLNSLTPVECTELFIHLVTTGLVPYVSVHHSTPRPFNRRLSSRSKAFFMENVDENQESSNAGGAGSALAGGGPSGPTKRKNSVTAARSSFGGVRENTMLVESVLEDDVLES